MKIRESGEMYLETILLLSQKRTLVRATDIAEELGYSKPSISRAMKILKNKGCIIVDEKSGAITLTESGRILAETIYERHEVLTKVLTYLGVDTDIAAEDACRIEHVISTETFECIKKRIKEHKNE